MATQTSVAQVVAKTTMANSTKRDLLSLINGLVDDVETLRSTLNTVLAKLDTAGATVGAVGTTNATTYGVAQTSLKIKK